MKLRLFGGLAAACLMLSTPAMAQTYTGPIAQATADPVPVNISTSTTTELVAASGTKTVIVTGGLIYAGGTVNLTFKAGTGSSCGTGTRSLSGPIPLKDQGGFTVGSGLGVQLKTQPGEALCATTDAAVAVGGWLMVAPR
ncbi:MAG TPA: hypothetical protein VFH92_11380 [Phenylobacterium sp.]|nr:hypothetical protein [Phenylobacterium sp.]